MPYKENATERIRIRPTTKWLLEAISTDQDQSKFAVMDRLVAAEYRRLRLDKKEKGR